jgi:hypothetical protein
MMNDKADSGGDSGGVSRFYPDPRVNGVLSGSHGLLCRPLVRSVLSANLRHIASINLYRSE